MRQCTFLFYCHCCCPVPAEAQFPSSKGAQDGGYSQCPCPNGAAIREKLAELAPPSTLGLPRDMDAFKVSMWGSKENMIRSAHETLGLAVLKYTAKGCREVSCVSAEMGWQLSSAIHEKMEQPMPELNESTSIFKVMADVLHSNLGPEGLVVASELEGMAAYRATVGAGSVLFLPAGTMFSERTVGGQFAYGWRTSVVEHADVLTTLQGWCASAGGNGKGKKVWQEICKASSRAVENGKEKVNPPKRAVDDAAAGAEGAGATRSESASSAAAAAALPQAVAVDDAAGAEGAVAPEAESAQKTPKRIKLTKGGK